MAATQVVSAAKFMLAASPGTFIFGICPTTIVLDAFNYLFACLNAPETQLHAAYFLDTLLL